MGKKEANFSSKLAYMPFQLSKSIPLSNPIGAKQNKKLGSELYSVPH